MGRLKNLEAGVLLPTPDDLQRLARAYGQPEITGWPVPVRDLELVTEVVKLHHDRAVELGANDLRQVLARLQTSLFGGLLYAVGISIRQTKREGHGHD